MISKSNFAVQTPVSCFLVAPSSNSSRESDLQKQIQKLEEEINDHDQQIRDLEQSLKNDTFFVFENAEDVIRPKIDTIRSERGQLFGKQRELKQVLSTQIIVDSGYPLLDYSPLGWLNKETKLPSFYILNIKHSFITLQVEHEGMSLRRFRLIGGRSTNPDIYPDEISALYKEAAINLVEKNGHGPSFKNYTTSISISFRGAVPSQTRTKIKQAQKTFDEIFIIGEAQSWQVNSVTVSEKDPLVVGWKSISKKMFLIDSFDPTPLETYLLEQHII